MSSNSVRKMCCGVMQFAFLFLHLLKRERASELIYSSFHLFEFCLQIPTGSFFAKMLIQQLNVFHVRDGIYFGDCGIFQTG